MAKLRPRPKTTSSALNSRFSFEPKKHFRGFAGEIKAFGVFDHQTFISKRWRASWKICSFPAAETGTRWRTVVSAEIGAGNMSVPRFPAAHEAEFSRGLRPFNQREIREKSQRANRDIRCWLRPQKEQGCRLPPPSRLCRSKEGQSPATPSSKAMISQSANKVLVKFWMGRGRSRKLTA